MLGMKREFSLNGLRGKWLSLVVITIVFTIILLLAWEKTPLVTISLPQNRLEVISPVIYNKPSKTSASIKRETDTEDGFLNGTIVKEIRTERNETNTKLLQVTDLDQKNTGAAPINSMTARLPDEGKKPDDLMIQVAERSKVAECNYAKGKWVADSRRPLYSGFGCKRWLSNMWACRLTKRTDFSYEGFRWQPENCEMPEFDGSTFLKRMHDKTIALVGDSLGRQQFQSLMCMLTGGSSTIEVEDVGFQYGLTLAKGAIRPDGWAYRFPSTNTTILYYWSASLCHLEPLNTSDPSTDYAMHLDRPVLFLQRYLERFDVLVLNTGHHWNRGKFNANRWVMHVNGERNKDRKLATVGGAKNFTIYSVVKWLDSELLRHPQIKAFFRTISPRHFFNGEWNTGGNCDNTTPLLSGDTVSKEESEDLALAAAVKGTRIGLLDITAISQLRDEAHISRYSSKAADGFRDCLHWCLPGIPDAWNEILAAQL